MGLPSPRSPRCSAPFVQWEWLLVVERTLINSNQLVVPPVKLSTNGGRSFSVSGTACQTRPERVHYLSLDISKLSCLHVSNQYCDAIGQFDRWNNDSTSWLMLFCMCRWLYALYATAHPHNDNCNKNFQSEEAFQAAVCAHAK